MLNKIEAGLQKFRYYTGTPEGRNALGKEVEKKTLLTVFALLAIGGIHRALIIAEVGMGIEYPEDQSRDVTTYTVEPRDNFWRLNFDRGTDPNCVARANGIKDQRLIHPGQKIEFPSECRTSNK